MNAGQRLVTLSGLPSGSAAAHLLAIQAGGGAGTGATVFSAIGFVVMGEQRLTVLDVPAQGQEAVAVRPAPVQSDTEAKDVVIWTAPEHVYIVHTSRDVFVTLSHLSVPLVQDAGEFTLTHPRDTSTLINK